MPTAPPYPVIRPALGLLDCRATLQDTPSISPNLTYTNLPPLSFLLLADRLAALYEMIFPDQPEWLDEEVVNWEGEEEVAAAVERFLGRVSTLFPVHDDIWDVDPSAGSGEALEVIEWRLYEIPVIPMGYDLWYDDWLDLKEPAPYLLHMRHSRHPENSPYLRNDFADMYPDYQMPLSLEPHRLVKPLRQMVCEQTLPEPLAALPDLIEMLDYSTGNWWLDVGEMSLMDGGGYPLWDAEDVKWLAAEWQKAQPVITRVHQLLDWQNGSPEEIRFKLSAVHDVLLDAYHQVEDCVATTTES